MLGMLYATAHQAVLPSVTQVNLTKTVEVVRIVKFLQYSSPIHASSFCEVSFIQKF